jgi:SagB-type dehydrogenase family enzyme
MERQALAQIALGVPTRKDGEGIWQVMEHRRSKRDYGRESLSFDLLSQLVWATQGITAREGPYLFRTVPSAGALYPIETYLIVHRIERLNPGIYHLDVARSSLELLREGDFSREIVEAALNQSMAASAAVVLVWTAVIKRSSGKYGERASRYIYLDAGHIGQNLYLAATALKLGCCTIGAFYDDKVNQVIGVDGKEETAIYLGIIGKPR